MNDVAVSIVNHRNRELLLACLASLADDPGRRAAMEVVVLDNASEDGSVEAVRRSASRTCACWRSASAPASAPTTTPSSAPRSRGTC